MWLYLIVAFLLLMYYLLKKNVSFWKNLGVPGPKPLLFIGNIGPNLIGKKHMAEVIRDIYIDYKEYPFIGVYRAGTPCLVPRDPEIIKNIIVKDFKYFRDNDVFVDKKVDQLFGRNPFVLKGEEWKTTRQQLTPSFSSGKMKALFPLIEDISNRLVKYVEEQGTSASEIVIDAKEICTRYTCDNVAVCAFGLEAKCFKEPNSEFRQLAHQFITPGSLVGFKVALSFLVPELANLFSIKLVPKHVEARLIDIITKTIDYRKENNVTRNDFLDSVSQLLKASSFNMVDVTAHASSFFVDGVETSSTVMAFTLLELAMNQECQTKLRDEIFRILKENGNVFSYEALQKMTYLDACVNETLRLHPAAGLLQKTCTERYTVDAASSEYKKLNVTIEPKTPVIIPVLGLHMDPKYFPEPEKYIPERFLNKEHTYKYFYLPFGDGPRMCLGQKFGLLQTKIGVAQIIRNFQVTQNEKTQWPLEYMPFHLLLFPKKGIWLNFRKI